MVDFAPQAQNKNLHAVLIGAGVLVVVGGLTMGFLHEPKPESLADQHANAITACREFVTRQLRAPATAKFPSYDDMAVSGNNPYTVVSSVDSENGFGALLRSSFTCTVSDLGDDWRADDVRLT